MRKSAAIFGSRCRALPHCSSNILRLYRPMHDRHLRVPAYRPAHVPVQPADPNQLSPNLHHYQLRNVSDLRDELRNVSDLCDQLRDMPDLRNELRNMSHELRNLPGAHMRNQMWSGDVRRMHACRDALPRT